MALDNAATPLTASKAILSLSGRGTGTKGSWNDGGRRVCRVEEARESLRLESREWVQGIVEFWTGFFSVWMVLAVGTRVDVGIRRGDVPWLGGGHQPAGRGCDLWVNNITEWGRQCRALTAREAAIIRR